MKCVDLAIAVGVLLGLAGLARAGSVINYTVGGSGPVHFPAATTPPADAPWGSSGYPGDTVEFLGYTGTLNLDVGTYVQQINTLKWTIDYTYGGTATDPTAWSDQLISHSVDRSMLFDTASAGFIRQDVALRATWENDYLALAQGESSTFIVSGYQVVVTPLALDPIGGTNFAGDNPWIQPAQVVTARFDVTTVPVPLPASVQAGLAMLAGVGVLCAFRSQLSRKPRIA